MIYDRSNALAAEVVSIVASELHIDPAELREVQEQVADRLRQEITEIEHAAAGKRIEGLD